MSATEGLADEDEFTQYVRTARPALRRTAYRLTADWYEADDLVQRTLIALHRRWDRLRQRDKIASYTHTIMVRLLISDRRTQRWTCEILLEQPPEPAPAPDTAAHFDDRLMLLDALAELAPRQRTAVILRYWNDRSVEQTAQAMGCMDSTVRSQTVRALDALRSSLQSCLQDGNPGDAGGT